MSRYLIIGGNSQLGISLAQQLKKQEKSPEIWTTTRNSTCLKHDNKIHLDLKKPFLPDYDFQTTFFCAGITSVDECEKQADKTKLYNFINTVKLAQALSKAGSKVIFPSSSLIFDGSKALYQISDKPTPIPLYGQYKAAAELEILKSSKKNMIIRLSKVLTPDYALFKHWIKQLKKEKPVSAFYNLTMAPISMEFACKQIINLAKQNATGIWHISAKTDISYYDIARYIANLLNKSDHLVCPENAEDKLIFVPEFSSLNASLTDKNLKIHTPDSWYIIKKTIGNMI